MKTIVRGVAMLIGGLLVLAILVWVIFPPDRVDNGANFHELTGPYLGQAPPGEKAKQFAPGIVDEDLHTVVIFSPDGQFIAPVESYLIFSAMSLP